MRDRSHGSRYGYYKRGPHAPPGHVNPYIHNQRRHNWFRVSQQRARQVQQGRRGGPPSRPAEDCRDIASLCGELRRGIDQLLARSHWPTAGPEWHEAPFQAVERDFRIEACNDTPKTMDGSGNYLDVTSFTVPTSSTGVITHLGLWADGWVAWGEVTWRLTVNGRSVSGFRDFQCPYGSAARPEKIPPIFLPPGAEVKVQAKADVATHAVRARLQGYHFVPLVEQQSSPARMMADRM